MPRLQCLAIIPDGNRRWAKKRGLPAIEGHRRSLYNGRRILQVALEHSWQVVVWCASRSNLESRKKEEKDFFFWMLRDELRLRLRRTDKVRFLLRGAWREFCNDPIIPELAAAVERYTSTHHEHQLTLLLGYDGEQDIEQAAQKLHDQGIRPTRELIRANLWTAHLPNADMIIRTGVEGDPHDSDAFLPLQRKNAQLSYTEILCPDYTEEHLRAALDNFAARERRMGA
ncbi:MAG: undecaprenyl diphosphate synthase [Candidatus Adlerbacteria bacterium GW2011_GWB1_54_7]|uniref:Undecaprenyl diphosphate synthase n=1 Tax=Candidatus Adlerbacteria bacterium GW2011_GWB1_54_7 TaxID=1618607 RepID=A0A0G2AAG9_9BACT|nr:MAG: undecaprenyl diphosphate synthase [Candidatus Adlerbacteria bacterium GW2011_GWB1_54_7]